MTRIRPISPSLAHWQRRQREPESHADTAASNTLPVPASPSQEPVRGTVSLLDCALNVQMLASPPRRGIRASAMEQARFHAAYRQAVNPARPAKWQKTA